VPSLRSFEFDLSHPDQVQASLANLLLIDLVVAPEMYLSQSDKIRRDGHQIEAKLIHNL